MPNGLGPSYIFHFMIHGEHRVLAEYYNRSLCVGDGESGLLLFTHEQTQRQSSDFKLYGFCLIPG